MKKAMKKVMKKVMKAVAMNKKLIIKKRIKIEELNEQNKKALNTTKTQLYSHYKVLEYL